VWLFDVVWRFSCTGSWGVLIYYIYFPFAPVGGGGLFFVFSMCGREEFFSFLAEISRKIEKKKRNWQFEGVGGGECYFLYSTISVDWHCFCFLSFFLSNILFYPTLPSCDIADGLADWRIDGYGVF